MASGGKTALTVKRETDLSKWYQALITEAGLADRSSVRGCMVMRPWGYALWENMQSLLDKKFKEYGVQNCYFPLFIPVDLFSKEAEHVSGFAKEMAIVTHSKLELVNGKLAPADPIEVPLAVRPTSEMIIGESFAKWISSYRDLPLKVNQWCNVVRWEMRTRLFLRTMEFLWHEGHAAFASREEAQKMAEDMHDVYYWFIAEVLKIPSIKGVKPVHEKFPGAVETYTIESMMQDGKALQAATSHYLGQHFSKAVGIQFQNAKKELEYAHTISWGLSTRLIGGLIMVHGDDNGLNTPVAVAPYHVVIVPIIKEESDWEPVLEYANKIKSLLSENRVLVDSKDYPPQNKKWDYVRKGVPIICEIGLRDVLSDSVCFTRRQPSLLKENCHFYTFPERVSQILQEHDESLLNKALEKYEQKVNRSLTNFEDLKNFFDKQNGFAIAKWSEDPQTLQQLEELGVSIRCCLKDSEKNEGRCIISREKATKNFVFAKAY